jgi:uncharacterized membrane protein
MFDVVILYSYKVKLDGFESLYFLAGFFNIYEDFLTHTVLIGHFLKQNINEIMRENNARNILECIDVEKFTMFNSLM